MRSKRLWLHEARVQPVLLVMEDLHWVDSETQALLDRLVERLPTARLLPPGRLPPGVSAPLGQQDVLHTTAPRPAAARERARAPPGPPRRRTPGSSGSRRSSSSRPRGIPFFLEEAVRTLVETGALGGTRGAHHLARPIESIQVPATVETVLAARMDRLPPDARQLIQAASVIGKDVPLVLLRAIADVPEDALRRGLATLQGSRVPVRGRPRSRTSSTPSSTP